MRTMMGTRGESTHRLQHPELAGAGDGGTGSGWLWARSEQ